MLVLTRKVNESINIGDDIVIKVVEIEKNKVKLGIEAPKSVSVYRHEVYLKIKEEKKIEAPKEIPFRKEYIILSSFIFFLIVGFNFIGKFNKFKEKKNQLKIVKRRLLREGKGALKSIEELRSDKVKFKKILAQFEYFKSSKRFFSVILKALSKNLPQGVWIERLSLVGQEEKGNVLFLEGFSYAKEESERMDLIKKFVSNIRKNFFNYFDKIILKEISGKVYKGYRVSSFRIECR